MEDSWAAGVLLSGLALSLGSLEAGAGAGAGVEERERLREDSLAPWVSTSKRACGMCGGSGSSVVLGGCGQARACAVPPPPFLTLVHLPSAAPQARKLPLTHRQRGLLLAPCPGLEGMASSLSHFWQLVQHQEGPGWWSGRNPPPPQG